MSMGPSSESELSELELEAIRLLRKTPPTIVRRFTAELAWHLLPKAKRESNLQLLSICYAFLGRKKKSRWKR